MGVTVETIIFITIFFYMMSTAGYVAYLFIQKNILQRAAFYLLMAGFLCHSATIGYAFVKSGVFCATQPPSVMPLLNQGIFPFKTSMKRYPLLAGPSLEFF